jgi:hypothetical protein
MDLPRWLPLLCLATAVPLLAQPQLRTTFAPVAKGLTLPDVERTEFHSRFTGQDYNVYVSLPASYSRGNQRYPALYVPDVDQGFLGIRGASFFLGMGGLTGTGDVLEEFILVGVPLKSESVLDWARMRSLDLTPTEVESWNASTAKLIGGAIRSGGAPLFLRALKEEVIPFIEANYRTTPDRGLAGYSFGGLFAAYVWLNDGETFSRYLIGSPSLWWDQRVLLKTEAALAESGKTLRGRVFLSVGAEEGETQVGPFKDFTAALARHAYPNLRLESQIFVGENHRTGILTALSRGVNSLYVRPRSQP